MKTTGKAGRTSVALEAASHQTRRKLTPAQLENFAVAYQRLLDGLYVHSPAHRQMIDDACDAHPATAEAPAQSEMQEAA